MPTLAEVYNDEPMVDEKLGAFGAIRVPVRKTSGAARFIMSPADEKYLTAQTQEVHNDLLNTFYPNRAEMPDWKERGREVEQNDPRYTDKDAVVRGDLGVTSSVVQDTAYDKDKNLGYVKVNEKWLTFNASPEQFKNFLSSGSLGKELSNIRNNKSTSMTETAARLQPVFNSIV